MKMEFSIGGKVVVIEAQGNVSVQILETVPLPAAPEPSEAPENPVFARLAALRRELASQQGVPPYVIFHDKTLREMSEALPQDLPSLGKIGGIGQAKLEKYGQRFLEVIHGAA